MKRWTERHGVGRSSGIPAIVYDGKSTGLRAGEEMDMATWIRKMQVIPHLQGPCDRKSQGKRSFLRCAAL